MAMDWAIILGNMQSLGLFQFVFPFLLILAIAYGALSYSVGEVLPKSARGLVSIIIAFFVMNYSGSAGVAIADFFSNIFGGMLIVASAILVIIIILGLLGLKIGSITKGEGTKTTAAFVVAVIFIAFLIFLGAGAGVIPGLTSVTLNSEFWTIIFFIVVLVIVLWVLGRESEGAAPAGGEGEK